MNHDQIFLFLNCLEHLYLTVDGKNVLHFTKCFAFYMQAFVFPKVFLLIANDIVNNFAHKVHASIVQTRLLETNFLSFPPMFKLMTFRIASI